MCTAFLRNIALSALLCLYFNVQTAQAAIKLGSYYGKWAATETYAAGDVVTFTNKTYLSLIAANKNKNPAKVIKAWQILGTDGSFNYAMICGTSGKEACKIGAVGPGGGWIFLVDKEDQYPGFTYLEAAPTDIAKVAWCSDTTHSIPAVSGWSSYAVGAGKANTTAMLGGCTSGAANAAHAYSTATTLPGDWFLPSLSELKWMYNNLQDLGVGGFSNSSYWSSTEYDAGDAWSQHFHGGNQFPISKGNPLPVRAVRAF